MFSCAKTHKQTSLVAYKQLEPSASKLNFYLSFIEKNPSLQMANSLERTSQPRLNRHALKD